MSANDSVRDTLERMKGMIDNAYSPPYLTGQMD